MLPREHPGNCVIWEKLKTLIKIPINYKLKIHLPIMREEVWGILF